jgi:hypothetical protein
MGDSRPGRYRNCCDKQHLGMASTSGYNCHDQDHLWVALSDKSTLYRLVSTDTVRSKQVRFLLPLSPPPEDAMNEEEGRRSLRDRVVSTLDSPREDLKFGSGSSWGKGHLADLDVVFHPRRVVSFDSILRIPPGEWTQEINDRMDYRQDS